jgi:hypothetical protein
MTPSVTNAAQYDPGDGVWRVYSARTITLAAGSSYISFRGAWTNSSRTYERLFSGTLNSGAYTCQTEGSFSNTPAKASAYAEMFASAQALVSVTTNPFPILTGTPDAYMFYRTFQWCTVLTNIAAGTLNSSGLTGAPAIGMFNQTFYSCSVLKNVPTGTLDTSGITGPPAQNMFGGTFVGCSALKSIPAGTLNSSGVTGTPASAMFYGAFFGCSSLTNIPAGTLTAAGLSGTPAANMFNQTFQNCSSLVAGDYNISSNVTFTSNNIASSMPTAFAGMTKWTGTVYWGTNRIYDAIPNPATDANVFQNSTLVPGYTNMQSNWK